MDMGIGMGLMGIRMLGSGDRVILMDLECMCG